jgi:hypothetical protein
MKTERFLFDGVRVSPRAHRVLSTLGLRTWADVATTSPAEFFRHPHCGPVTVRELGKQVSDRAAGFFSKWTTVVSR